MLPRKPKVNCVEIKWVRHFKWNNCKDYCSCSNCIQNSDDDNCPGRFFDGNKFYNVNFKVFYETVTDVSGSQLKYYYYYFKYFGEELVVYSLKELRGRRLVMIKHVNTASKNEIPGKIKKWIESGGNVYVDSEINN